jgi:hypothetical protein
MAAGDDGSGATQKKFAAVGYSAGSKVCGALAAMQGKTGSK